MECILPLGLWLKTLEFLFNEDFQKEANKKEEEDVFTNMSKFTSHSIFCLQVVYYGYWFQPKNEKFVYYGTQFDG